MTLIFASPSHLRHAAQALVGQFRRQGSDAQRLDDAVRSNAAFFDLLRGGEAAFLLVSAEGLAALPDDLIVAAALEREEPRDVLIPATGTQVTLESLPSGARVGVGSARRRGFLLAHRPDVVPVRPGNGGGPADALASGSVDALILGSTEARGVGLAGHATEILDGKAWVPAPGQGTLLLVCRADDDGAAALCTRVDHAPTHMAFRAETTAAAAQGGGPDAPLGALAMPHGQWIRVWGMAASEDGRRVVRGDVTGRSDDPDSAGRALAELLFARGAGAIHRSMR